MFRRILSDLDSIIVRDPAARSRLEILLCYPGVHAMFFYRISHCLWRFSALRLPARLVAYGGRILTGVEIHPGATIGRRLFIDHGFGVVIGETSTIGDDVTIYHDVTLGGTSLEKGIRHPQIGNGVIIGAGAQLLGPIRVGHFSRVGSNAVVIADIAPGTTVVGVPARPLEERKPYPEPDDHHFTAYGTPKDTLGYPTPAALIRMEEELQHLRQRVEELERQSQGIERTAEGWDAKS